MFPTVRCTLKYFKIQKHLKYFDVVGVKPEIIQKCIQNSMILTLKMQALFWISNTFYTVGFYTVGFYTVIFHTITFYTVVFFKVNFKTSQFL
jgi:hypothetical protein